MNHQRHIPAQPPTQPVPDLTLAELAALKRVHPSHILRLVEQGLPCADLAAIRKPGRRPKRLLRFRVEEVEAWLRERSPAGGSR